MTKICKIIQYNLQDDVDRLLEEGRSTYKIAAIIRDHHPDNEDLKNISHSSVYRYNHIYDSPKLKVSWELSKIRSVINGRLYRAIQRMIREGLVDAGKVSIHFSPNNKSILINLE